MKGGFRSGPEARAPGLSPRPPGSVRQGSGLAWRGPGTAAREWGAPSNPCTPRRQTQCGGLQRLAGPERAPPSFLKPELPGGAVAASVPIGGRACAPPLPAPRRPPPPGRDPPLSAGGVAARGWVAGSSRQLCAPASGLARRGRGGGGRRRLSEHSGQSCGLRAPLLPPRVPRWLPRPAAAPAPRAPLCPPPGAAAAAAGSEPAPWATEAAVVRARAPRRCRTRSPCRNSWPRPMRTTRRPRPPASPRARPSAGTPWRPSRR